MYYKDRLNRMPVESGDKREHRMFAMLLSLALGLSVAVGCGAKGTAREDTEPAGTVSGSAGETAESDVRGDTGSGNEVAGAEVNAKDEAVTEAEEDLPPLAYKTAEERQHQKKPNESEWDMRNIAPSNQFFMVEEFINEPEGGWPEDMKCINDVYVKLKGTLYEVYYYGEPDYDFVYFPGDELPEGYEVKVTEGYELQFADTAELGDGHSDIMASCVYLVTNNEKNKVCYEQFFSGMKPKEGLDMNTPVKDLGPFPYEQVLQPGTYVDVTYVDAGVSAGYRLYQYLTEEDLEKLPEDTNLEGIAHY